MRHQRTFWILISIILFATALRTYHLSIMVDMVNFDEAYYGLDALSLIENPRLTPFFPQNFGRESLWMYWLAPFLAIYNPTGLGLRLPAILASIIVFPAFYITLRQFFSRRLALWGVGALAVLYWHVHMSHISWRLILFPSIGMVAWALIWRAYRHNRINLWLSGGFMMGVLGYTYFSARTWLAVYVVMLIWWAWREATKRKGVAVAIIATGITLLPLILYTLTNTEANLRASQVLVTDPSQVIQNALAWLPMWFIEGASDEIHGYIGRPILDIALTILAFLGIAGIWTLREKRQVWVWLFLMVGASLAPAILSDDATHLRRSFGTIIPLATLLGVGAWWLETQLSRWIKRGAWLVPIVLLAVGGFITAQDFREWVTGPKPYTLMEQYLYRTMDELQANAPDDVPIYFAPFSYNHPVMNFLDWKVDGHPYGAFESHDCVVLPEADTVLYASAALYDLALNDRLKPWMTNINLWHEEANSPTGTPRYVIWEASPRSDLFEGWQDAGVFGDDVQIRLLSSLPDTVQAGERLWLEVGMRTTKGQDRALSLFTHLYGETTPYEGGELWAQTDGGICLSHPPYVWRTDEIIVQYVGVPLPADLPTGEYDIAFGIYDTVTLERLTVSNPTNEFNYWQSVTVNVIGSQ